MTGIGGDLQKYYKSRFPVSGRLHGSSVEVVSNCSFIWRNFFSFFCLFVIGNYVLAIDIVWLPADWTKGHL